MVSNNIPLFTRMWLLIHILISMLVYAIFASKSDPKKRMQYMLINSLH